MPIARKVSYVLVVELVVLAALGLVVADQLAHKRVEMLAGVNMWGYRGTVMPRRQAEEIRVAVVGGDRVFGWGVGPGETMPAYLATALGVHVRDAVVTVVNLGAVGLPARDYDTRLAGYHYLRPDIVCLYVDLSDRSARVMLPRDDSAITASSGYVPMLPLLLVEKGRAWTNDGRTVLGAFIAFAGSSLESVDRLAHRVIYGAADDTPEDRLMSLERAVDTALGMAKAVVVVVPMPVNPAEQEVHPAARALFETRASQEPRLRVVDLADVTALENPDLRLDALHFGAAGHSMAATAVAPAIVAMIERLRAAA